MLRFSRRRIDASSPRKRANTPILIVPGRVVLERYAGEFRVHRREALTPSHFVGPSPLPSSPGGLRPSPGSGERGCRARRG
jgi:hypothetical protein